MAISQVDLIRVAAVAAPSIAPATIPAWGPPIISVIGINIPIASMVFSMLGLFLARSIVSEHDKAPKPLVLTLMLAIMLMALVIDNKPSITFAAIWGVGIGGSGLTIFGIIQHFVVGWFEKMFSSDKGPQP